MRIRRTILAAAVAGSAMLLPAAANAAVTLSVQAGGPVYTGPTPTYTFDPGSRPVATNGGFVNTTVGGQYAQPYGSTGYYFSVGPSTSTPASINLSSFADINEISLLWGSVDLYNRIEFLAGGVSIASYTGADIINAFYGEQSLAISNPIVTFAFTGSHRLVDSILLSSSTNAFELDNLRIAAVPEPSTWAMMLLGFGLVGAAMRSARRKNVPACTC